MNEPDSFRENPRQSPAEKRINLFHVLNSNVKNKTECLKKPQHDSENFMTGLRAEWPDDHHRDWLYSSY